MDVKKCEKIPLLARQFRRLDFFESLILKVFDTFMSFCYFRALDLAPTYAVPGLLE